MMMAKDNGTLGRDDGGGCGNPFFFFYLHD